MFSQNCKINNRLFEVQFSCSFLSPTRASFQQPDNFLNRFSSPQPQAHHLLSCHVGPIDKKRTKRSLKTVNQKHLKIDSMIKNVRPGISELYHQTIETEQYQALTHKLTKSTQQSGLSQTASPLESSTFNSQHENCPGMYFGRSNFQKKFIEEKQRITSNQQKSSYFEQIPDNEPELPLQSNIIQNTLERRLSSSISKPDQTLEEDHIMSIPNFFSYQDLKCSEEAMSDDRQVSSTIIMKRKSERRENKFEDLRFKDTESVGSVSDHTSEVISEDLRGSNLRDKLSEIAMISVKRRRTVMPNYSQFR